MIAYILDNKTLKVKDILEFEKYSFADDIDIKNKSFITAVVQPNVANDDFVVCKDGNKTLFNGICTDYNSRNKTVDYKLTLRPMACLFDRPIFADNGNLIATSIEAFIVKAITDNWISSGDSMTDLPYLTAAAETNTPVSASLSTIGSVSEGTYNLKTFLGNAKESYQIFVDFEFSDIPQNPALTVTVRKDNAAALAIDLLVSDVVSYDETYDVDVLSKLLVRWTNTETEATQDLAYYLLADRSITTDATDPNRAAGVTKSITIEAATQAEMYDKVLEQFRSNSYQHKIGFDVLIASSLYDASAYYVGRLCTVKTKSGIRTSLITATTWAAGKATAHIDLGKLKVTLIDKIRGLE